MTDLIPLVPTVIIPLLWYLLKQKDDKQQKQVDILFTKHDEDAKALTDLKLKIAERHYEKNELDYKFDKLELTIKNSFDSLGIKFDKLSDVLVSHIHHEDKK